MVAWTEDRILSLVVTVLSILSFIGVMYIFLSVVFMRILSHKHSSKKIQFKSNIILNTHIFYVSICGIFNYGLLIANFAPFTVSGTNYHYPDAVCTVIGASTQFGPISEAMWYCLVSITLNMIVNHKWTITNLNDNLKWHHCAAWSTGIIVSGIPFIGQAYGKTSNANGDTEVVQCWIDDQHRIYYLSFYIPFSILMIIDIFALIRSYSILKLMTEKSLSTYIIKKCFLFVFLYLLFWISPIITRLLQIGMPDWKTPFFLLVAHHIGISSGGIYTALIWGTSTKSFIPFWIGAYFLFCGTIDDFYRYSQLKQNQNQIHKKQPIKNQIKYFNQYRHGSSNESSNASNEHHSFQDVYKVPQIISKLQSNENTLNNVNVDDIDDDKDDRNISFSEMEQITNKDEDMYSLTKALLTPNATVTYTKSKTRAKKPKQSHTSSRLRADFDSDGLESTDS